MSRFASFSAVLAAGTVLVGLSGAARAYEGYYRDPSAGADRIAFAAERSVWVVGRSGGVATRLTAPLGVDPHPVLSPDGTRVAFTAVFDGPREIYVMPVTGGLPKRITFTGNQAEAVGWDAQGEVLFDTLAETGAGPWSRVVGAVNPETGATRIFPLADAVDAMVSADGRWIYFTRFGLGVTGDHVRDYRGGAMSQLWRFDLLHGTEAERIGDRDANLRRPMPWRDPAGQERLLVVSDAGGRDAVWSLAPDGTDGRRIGEPVPDGIRAASLSGDRVVFEAGADLRALDLGSGRVDAVPVDLVSDRAARQPRFIDHPLEFLDSATLSPDGTQVVVTARGRVAIAAPGSRRRVEIAAPADTRLRDARMSPDGKTVYAIADTTGEEEVWAFPANGAPGGKALTRGGDTRRWEVIPSPDGRMLAHDDKHGRLHVLDLASGADRVVDDGGKDGATQYDRVAWSPDSKALVFVRSGPSNDRRRIGLVTLADNRMLWLTDDRYESFDPAFSPDGRWLWFLSDRAFNLANDAPWGDRNTGPVFVNRTEVFALALQTGERFPFQAADELHPAPAPGADKAEAAAKPVGSVPAIDPDGLPERLFQAPVPAGEYGGLEANRQFLFLLSGHADDGPDDKGRVLRSVRIDAADPKAQDFAPAVKRFALSADGNTLFLEQAPEGPGGSDGPKPDDRFTVVKAGEKLPSDTKPGRVALGDWRLRVDPAAEWAEEFHDAWRLHRDYFYDARLRGVDWVAQERRFAALLPRLGDRSDLDDLLGQMTGELGALHSQVRPADLQLRPASDSVAGLGAELVPVADGLRVARIYRNQPDLVRGRSPLAAPGVDVQPGDVITAIDGQPAAGVRDPGELLRTQAGHQVLLAVKRGDAAPHPVVVVADSAKAEQALRYRDWEQGRAAIVARESGGRIGYLHLQAMGAGDIADFVRDFYANTDKDGLIVDVRRNRGGNIDSWVLGTLMRRAWMFWGRYDARPEPNMQHSFRGHMVVLCDALTYSDGETFTQGIKLLHLAPVIGERTAGAGVWLSDDNVLEDRGVARAAQNPQFDLAGHWLVENRGVEPDIVVPEMPVASFRGQDQQLEAGIATLQRELRDQPVPALTAGTIPPLPN